MRRALVGAIALVACVSCSSGTVTPLPANPSPTIGPPQTITLNALAGMGNSYGQAFLTARVFDANGRGVGSTVLDFSATDGVFTPTSHVTANSVGEAQTTLNTSQRHVTVNVHAGAIATALDVDINLPPPALTSPPPIFNPSPTPPPPTPSPAPPAVSVALTCTPASPPALSPCNVTVSENGLPATAHVASVAWDWGDGATTTTVPPTAPFSSHAYAQVGSYTVVAAVTMADAKTGSATQQLIVK